MVMCLGINGLCSARAALELQGGFVLVVVFAVYMYKIPFSRTFCTLSFLPEMIACHDLNV